MRSEPTENQQAAAMLVTCIIGAILIALIVELPAWVADYGWTFWGALK